MSKGGKTIAYIGMGSNLGEREANLERAISLFNENPKVKVLKQSKWMENPAVEDAGPDDFLNGVIKLETSLDAFELFALVQAIELEVDPEREKRGRKKARVLDLDILEFGEEAINTPDLTIPHPRMFQRDFVMKPLQEIQASDMAEELVAKVEAKTETVHVPAPFTDTGKENLVLMKQAQEKVKALIKSCEKFKVRRMYLDDVDQVFALDEVVFGEKHWGRGVFVKELDNRNAVYLVAEELKDGEPSGRILGYVGVWVVLDEMHIMTLGTDPEFRRSKIAESLVVSVLNVALENEVRAVTLEVRLSNVPAQNLYDRYGFYKQGVRKGYYDSDGEAALLYWTENIREDKFLENFMTQLQDLEGLLRGSY